jgi:serine/threonine protein kinase
LWLFVALVQVVGSHVRGAVGTTDFMAPEVSAMKLSTYVSSTDDDNDNDNGNDNDIFVEASPKQDIYSLGSTLQWLLREKSLLTVGYDMCM